MHPTAICVANLINASRAAGDRSRSSCLEATHPVQSIETRIATLDDLDELATLFDDYRRFYGRPEVSVPLVL